MPMFVLKEKAIDNEMTHIPDKGKRHLDET